MGGDPGALFVIAGDARVTLARLDLAASDLEGVARAPRYAAPTPMVVIAPVASLRRSPDADAEQLDQLILGEVFDVLDHQDGHAWGQARRDGYVGFVEERWLAEGPGSPSHRVAALATFAHAEPAVRAPARGPISLNALLTVDEEAEAFVGAAGVGWIPRAHVQPIGWFETDFVAVAERHLGISYHWGGRTSAGLDCSGLVLQSLFAAGRACPRDTDQQARIGRAVADGERRRGDLVFWKGHVGILLDADRLLHANAHHMAVAIEPFAEARERIAAAGGGEPTAFRRV